jgi:hypothetical protein
MEPYEMTLSEFTEEVKTGRQSIPITGAGSLNGNSLKLLEIAGYPYNQREDIQAIITTHLYRCIKDEHWCAVANAVCDGKTVPTDILSEYKDNFVLGVE